MSIVKNEIPILEYDDNPAAVLMPAHEKLHLALPERAVFAFLYDAVELYAKAHGGKVVSEFISATKTYPIYVVEYNGAEICMVQAPVGASAAVQILDWLIGYGVKKVISAGSCGALTDIRENEFLVPVKALRDEGTSYHYLPPSRFVEVNEKAFRAIEQALSSHGFNYREITTWSTDGFFRETAEKVHYRISEGCAAVEMECAALAACARFRKIIWGELLYTADSLACPEEYDCRDWGERSRESALLLCLEAAGNL